MKHSSIKKNRLNLLYNPYLSVIICVVYCMLVFSPIKLLVGIMNSMFKELSVLHNASIQCFVWCVCVALWSDIVYGSMCAGGHLKNTYELSNLRDLKLFHLVVKSFNVWARYFVWNFKWYLWNSTQNILPILWKIYDFIGIFQGFWGLKARKCFWNAPYVFRVLIGSIFMT